jgi:4-amino-4-deoxy-L-arabinose transferase-like glycosyltransferase
VGHLRASGFPVGLGLLVAIVAVPVLVIARRHGFDGLYGQDAFAYVGYGLGPLRAAVAAGQAPPDFPLPPGYPLLIAGASLVAGPVDAIGQAVSMLAGVSIPVLVALLAREILRDRDPRLALLAGLVAAVPGQLWQSSLVAMSDTPALAAATLGALAAVRFQGTGARRWLVLAAAALTLAAETRLIFGVTALIFGSLAAMRWLRDARSEPRRALAGGAVAIVVVLLVLAPAAIAIGDAISAGRPIPFAAELGVRAFDPLTPFRSSFETADGQLSYAWPMALWTLLQPVHWYWLGVLGLAVPIGLLVALRREGRSATEMATLVAWPGLTLLVLAFYPYQNPRFALATLPPIAILVALGLQAMWHTIRDRRPSLRALVLAAAAFAIGANAGLAWRYTDGFVVRQAADLAAIRTLEARIPPGARLASLGATAVLRHDGRDVTELYDLGPDAAAQLTTPRPVYVLVDADAFRTQWAGTRTGRAFELLSSAPGFAVVGRAGAWTLYEAGG